MGVWPVHHKPRIAGVQEKTAFLNRDGKWYKPLARWQRVIYQAVHRQAALKMSYFCLKTIAALGIEAAKPQMTDFREQKRIGRGAI
jgi:hypothetical protein